MLTATSSTQEIVEPDDLQTGAVVCELSLPHDVGPAGRARAAGRAGHRGRQHARARAPRFERVREPGRDFDLGLPPGTALACMSETMMLALEDRRECFTLGRGIDLAKVREMAVLAERNGFSLADMRAFDRAVTADDDRRHQAGGRLARLAAV